MADNWKNTKGAELLPVELKGYGMERRKEETTLINRGAFSSLYPDPRRPAWINRILLERINTAIEVAKSLDGLGNAMINLERTKGAWDDVDRIVEADRQQRRHDIGMAAMAQENDRLRMEIEQVMLKARLAEVRGESPMGREDKYQQQLDELKRKAEFDAEFRTQQAKNKVLTIQRLRAACESLVNEIREEKKGKLTPEDELDIENIRDRFQREIDNL